MATASELSALPGVIRAVRLGTAGETRPTPASWSLRELAGRLVEISGRGDGACLSLAFSLILDAQRQGETAAWVGNDSSSFFPVDAAAGGVDLDALVVVRVSGTRAILRATESLARSGAFGVVTFDLSDPDARRAPRRHDATPRSPRVSNAIQSRLRGLAQRHGTALLCLTHKASTSPSLGSLVSLRAEAHRHRREEDRFVCELQVLKDKRRGPGWSHEQTFRGPAGLY